MAFFLSLSFALLNCGVNLHAQPPAGETLPSRFPIDEAPISLPPELGVIQETYRGNSGQMVIYVQDAHTIPEAQRSIQRLIGYFQKRHGINLIALEGGTGKLDPFLFRTYPDRKNLESVFKDYLDRGELSGVAAAAVLNERPAEYYGIEDRKLYEAGMLAYLAADREIPEMLGKLDTFQRELDQKKEKIYPEELLKLDRAIKEFDEGKLDLASFLSVIAPSRHPEPATFRGGRRISDQRFFGLPNGEPQNDTTKYPHLFALIKEIKSEGSDSKAVADEIRLLARQLKLLLKDKSERISFNENEQAYQTGRLPASSFAHFLLELASGKRMDARHFEALKRINEHDPILLKMQAPVFFEELEAYLVELKARLSPNEEAKRLDELDQHLGLMRRLVRMELARRDWAALKRHYRHSESRFVSYAGEAGRRISVSEILRPLRGLRMTDREIGRLERRLTHPSSPFLRFYRIAEAREQVFIEKLRELFKKGPREILFLSGGFHTEGVTEAFKKRGLSYVVISPRITESSEEGLYQKMMRGEVSWRKYFKVRNGWVNLYEAFSEATTDRLAKVSLRGDDRRILKSWRDEVIRKLAEKKQTAKAGRYTRFIDQAALKSISPEELASFQSLWRSRLDRFLAGLKDLVTKNQLTEQNLLNLFKPAAMIPQLVGGDLLIPRSETRAEFLGLTPLSLTRAEVREEGLGDGEREGGIIDRGFEMLEEAQTEKPGDLDHLRNVVANRRHIPRFDTLDPNFPDRNQGGVDDAIGRDNGEYFPSVNGIIPQQDSRIPSNHRVNGTGVQDQISLESSQGARQSDLGDDDSAGLLGEFDSQAWKRITAYLLGLGSSGPVYVIYRPAFLYLGLRSLWWSLWRSLSENKTEPSSRSGSVNLNAIHLPWYLLFAVARRIFDTPQLFPNERVSQGSWSVNSALGHSDPARRAVASDRLNQPRAEVREAGLKKTREFFEGQTRSTNQGPEGPRLEDPMIGDRENRLDPFFFQDDMGPPFADDPSGLLEGLNRFRARKISREMNHSGSGKENEGLGSDAGQAPFFVPFSFSLSPFIQNFQDVADRFFNILAGIGESVSLANAARQSRTLDDVSARFVGINNHLKSHSDRKLTDDPEKSQLYFPRAEVRGDQEPSLRGVPQLFSGTTKAGAPAPALDRNPLTVPSQSDGTKQSLMRLLRPLRGLAMTKRAEVREGVQFSDLGSVKFFGKTERSILFTGEKEGEEYVIKIAREGHKELLKREILVLKELNGKRLLEKFVPLLAGSGELGAGDQEGLSTLIPEDEMLFFNGQPVKASLKPGQPYLVEEKIKGETLTKRIDRLRSSLHRAPLGAGTFGPPRLSSVSSQLSVVNDLIQIAKAIRVLHRNGVIHRELAPQEIFFLPEGEIRFVDFALAETPARPAIPKEYAGETRWVEIWKEDAQGPMRDTGAFLFIAWGYVDLLQERSPVTLKVLTLLKRWNLSFAPGAPGDFSDIRSIDRILDSLQSLREVFEVEKILEEQPEQSGIQADLRMGRGESSLVLELGERPLLHKILGRTVRLANNDEVLEITFFPRYRVVDRLGRETSEATDELAIQLMAPAKIYGKTYSLTPIRKAGLLRLREIEDLSTLAKAPGHFMVPAERLGRRKPKNAVTGVINNYHLRLDRLAEALKRDFPEFTAFVSEFESPYRSERRSSEVRSAGLNESLELASGMLAMLYGKENVEVTPASVAGSGPPPSVIALTVEVPWETAGNAGLMLDIAAETLIARRHPEYWINYDLVEEGNRFRYSPPNSGDPSLRTRISIELILETVTPSPLTLSPKGGEGRVSASETSPTAAGVHRTTKENLLKALSMRMASHEKAGRDLRKRKRENPVLTPEELDAGTFWETLEPEVRKAVELLREKGINTTSSGWYGEPYPVYSVIDGYGITREQAEAIKKSGLANVTHRSPIDPDPRESAEFLEGKLNHIWFPIRVQTREEIKARWNQIARLTPSNQSPPGKRKSPEAPEFRKRYENRKKSHPRSEVRSRLDGLLEEAGLKPLPDEFRMQAKISRAAPVKKYFPQGMIPVMDQRIQLLRKVFDSVSPQAKRTLLYPPIFLVLLEVKPAYVNVGTDLPLDPLREVFENENYQRNNQLILRAKGNSFLYDPAHLGFNIIHNRRFLEEELGILDAKEDEELLSLLRSPAESTFEQIDNAVAQIYGRLYERASRDSSKLNGFLGFLSDYPLEDINFYRAFEEEMKKRGVGFEVSSLLLSAYVAHPGYKGMEFFSRGGGQSLSHLKTMKAALDYGYSFFADDPQAREILQEFTVPRGEKSGAVTTTPRREALQFEFPRRYEFQEAVRSVLMGGEEKLIRRGISMIRVLQAEGGAAARVEMKDRELRLVLSARNGATLNRQIRSLLQTQKIDLPPPFTKKNEASPPVAPRRETIVPSGIPNSVPSNFLDLIKLVSENAFQWEALAPRAFYELIQKEIWGRLAPLGRDAKVLDWGIGEGDTVGFYTPEQRRQVTGLDRWSDFLDSLRRNFPEIQTLLWDGLKPFPSGTGPFKAAIGVNSLYYARNQAELEAILKNLDGVLEADPNGQKFILHLFYSNAPFWKEWSEASPISSVPSQLKEAMLEILTELGYEARFETVTAKVLIPQRELNETQRAYLKAYPPKGPSPANAMVLNPQEGRFVGAYRSDIPSGQFLEKVSAILLVALKSTSESFSRAEVRGKSKQFADIIRRLFQEGNQLFDGNLRTPQNRPQGARLDWFGAVYRNNRSSAKINLVPQDRVTASLPQQDEARFLKGSNEAVARDLGEEGHQGAMARSLMKTWGLARRFLSSSMDQRYSLIAFLILAIASAIVSPWEAHPGSAGTYTLYPPSDSSSITTLYLIFLFLFLFSPLYRTPSNIASIYNTALGGSQTSQGPVISQEDKRRLSRAEVRAGEGESAAEDRILGAPIDKLILGSIVVFMPLFFAKLMGDIFGMDFASAGHEISSWLTLTNRFSGNTVHGGLFFVTGFISWMVFDLAAAVILSLFLLIREDSLLRFSPYPDSDEVVKSAEAKGIGREGLEKWILTERTPHGLFERFREANLLDPKISYQEKAFKIFAKKVWQTIGHETLAQLTPSSIAEKFGLLGFEVMIGGERFHAIGVAHGRHGVILRKTEVLALVDHLKREAVPLYSEEGLPSYYGFSYGKEVRDQGLIQFRTDHDEFAHFVKLILMALFILPPALLIFKVSGRVTRGFEESGLSIDYLDEETWSSRGHLLGLRALQSKGNGDFPESEGSLKTREVVILSGAAHLPTTTGALLNQSDLHNSARAEVRGGTATEETIASEDLTLKAVMKREMWRALWKMEGNTNQAAELLEIDQKAFINRVRPHVPEEYRKSKNGRPDYRGAAEKILEEEFAEKGEAPEIRPLRKLEKSTILERFIRYGGFMDDTAKSLGIHGDTLIRKLRAFGIIPRAKRFEKLKLAANVIGTKPGDASLGLDEAALPQDQLKTLDEWLEPVILKAIVQNRGYANSVEKILGIGREGDFLTSRYNALLRKRGLKLDKEHRKEAVEKSRALLAEVSPSPSKRLPSGPKSLGEIAGLAVLVTYVSLVSNSNEVARVLRIRARQVLALMERLGIEESRQAARLKRARDLLGERGWKSQPMARKERPSVASPRRPKQSAPLTPVAYRILGLHFGASQQDIKSAYRRLSKQVHPDPSGKEEDPRFIRLSEAYQQVNSPEKQWKYERKALAASRGKVRELIPKVESYLEDTRHRVVRYNPQTGERVITVSPEEIAKAIGVKSDDAESLILVSVVFINRKLEEEKFNPFKWSRGGENWLLAAPSSETGASATELGKPGPRSEVRSYAGKRAGGLAISQVENIAFDQPAGTAVLYGGQWEDGLRKRPVMIKVASLPEDQELGNKILEREVEILEKLHGNETLQEHLPVILGSGRLNGKEAGRLAEIVDLDPRAPKEGNTYVIQEYIVGKTLSERIQAHIDSDSLEQVEELVLHDLIGLAEVFSKFHKAGVTHGDIKMKEIHFPSAPEGREEEKIKITDFGLAESPGVADFKTLMELGDAGPGNDNYLATYLAPAGSVLRDVSQFIVTMHLALAPLGAAFEESRLWKNVSELTGRLSKELWETKGKPASPEFQSMAGLLNFLRTLPRSEVRGGVPEDAGSAYKAILKIVQEAKIPGKEELLPDPDSLPDWLLPYVEDLAAGKSIEDLKEAILLLLTQLAENVKGKARLPNDVEAQAVQSADDLLRNFLNEYGLGSFYRSQKIFIADGGLREPHGEYPRAGAYLRRTNDVILNARSEGFIERLLHERLHGLSRWDVPNVLDEAVTEYLRWRVQMIGQGVEDHSLLSLLTYLRGRDESLSYAFLIAGAAILSGYLGEEKLIRAYVTGDLVELSREDPGRVWKEINLLSGRMSAGQFRRGYLFPQFLDGVIRVLPPEARPSLEENTVYETRGGFEIMIGSARLAALVTASSQNLIEAAHVLSYTGTKMIDNVAQEIISRQINPPGAELGFPELLKLCVRAVSQSLSWDLANAGPSTRATLLEEVNSFVSAVTNLISAVRLIADSLGSGDEDFLRKAQALQNEIKPDLQELRTNLVDAVFYQKLGNVGSPKAADLFTPAITKGIDGILSSMNHSEVEGILPEIKKRIIESPFKITFRELEGRAEARIETESEQNQSEEPLSERKKEAGELADSLLKELAAAREWVKSQVPWWMFWEASNKKAALQALERIGGSLTQWRGEIERKSDYAALDLLISEIYLEGKKIDRTLRSFLPAQQTLGEILYEATTGAEIDRMDRLIAVYGEKVIHESESKVFLVPRVLMRAMNGANFDGVIIPDVSDEVKKIPKERLLKVFPALGTLSRKRKREFENRLFTTGHILIAFSNGEPIEGLKWVLHHEWFQRLAGFDLEIREKLKAGYAILWKRQEFQEEIVDLFKETFYGVHLTHKKFAEIFFVEFWSQWNFHPSRMRPAFETLKQQVKAFCEGNSEDGKTLAELIHFVEGPLRDRTMSETEKIWPQVEKGLREARSQSEEGSTDNSDKQRRRAEVREAGLKKTTKFFEGQTRSTNQGPEGSRLKDPMIGDRENRLDPFFFQDDMGTPFSDDPSGLLERFNSFRARAISRKMNHSGSGKGKEGLGSDAGQAPFFVPLFFSHRSFVQYFQDVVDRIPNVPSDLGKRFPLAHAARQSRTLGDVSARFVGINNYLQPHSDRKLTNPPGKSQLYLPRAEVRGAKHYSGMRMTSPSGPKMTKPLRGWRVVARKFLTASITSSFLGGWMWIKRMSNSLGGYWERLEKSWSIVMSAEPSPLARLAFSGSGEEGETLVTSWPWLRRTLNNFVGIFSSMRNFKEGGITLAFGSSIPDSLRIAPQNGALRGYVRGSDWGSNPPRQFLQASPRLLRAQGPGRRGFWSLESRVSRGRSENRRLDTFQAEDPFLSFREASLTRSSGSVKAASIAAPFRAEVRSASPEGLRSTDRQGIKSEVRKGIQPVLEAVMTGEMPGRAEVRRFIEVLKGRSWAEIEGLLTRLGGELISSFPAGLITVSLLKEQAAGIGQFTGRPVNWGGEKQNGGPRLAAAEASPVGYFARDLVESAKNYRTSA